jgi:hypothetical protein
VITTLATDTRQKLALAKRLKDAQSEVSAITVTLAELEKLAAAARQLAAAAQVCRGRLGEDTVRPVLAQAAQLTGEIAASRKRFATGENRRENLTLNGTGRKLDRIAGDLRERWQRYAQERLAPYLELLALVVYLPEVAAREAEIRQLVRQISDQAKETPHSEAQLAQFDQRLTDLGRRLDSVASLSDEVRAFLMQVVAGKATLADLTPDIAAWLDEGDRTAAFAIMFVSRRS